MTPIVTAGLLAAGAVGVGAATWCGPQILRVPSVRALRHACMERRAICLTFDDGPGPSLTPRTLDLLGSFDVRATFYLLGFRAQAAPETADLVAAAGHEMGAHTMWHRHAWKSTPWNSYRDVENGYAALARWVAPRGRFRPPYGKLNIGGWLAAARRGAPIDWWTIDSGDTWATPPKSAVIAERVVRDGGGVVLLHDFDRDINADRRAQYVLDTAEAVVRRAASEGIRFMTMSELMSKESTR